MKETSFLVGQIICSHTGECYFSFSIISRLLRLPLTQPPTDSNIFFFWTWSRWRKKSKFIDEFFALSRAPLASHPHDDDLICDGIKLTEVERMRIIKSTHKHTTSRRSAVNVGSVSGMKIYYMKKIPMAISPRSLLHSNSHHIQLICN